MQDVIAEYSCCIFCYLKQKLNFLIIHLVPQMPNPVLPTVLTFSLIVTWIIIAVAFIGRRWLLDKIGLISKKEFAEYKAALDAKNKHNEIKFTKLVEEQMPVFKEFHELAIATQKIASNFSHRIDSPNRTMDLQIFKKGVLHFIATYEAKKIYFNSSLCDLMENFLLLHTSACLNAAQLGRHFNNNEELDKRQLVLAQIRDAGMVKEQLVLEFKQNMGVV